MSANYPYQGCLAIIKKIEGTLDLWVINEHEAVFKLDNVTNVTPCSSVPLEPWTIALGFLWRDFEREGEFYKFGILLTDAETSEDVDATITLLFASGMADAFHMLYLTARGFPDEMHLKDQQIADFLEKMRVRSPYFRANEPVLDVQFSGNRKQFLTDQLSIAVFLSHCKIAQ